MRAYEIIKHTKISLFDWYKKTKPKLPKNSYLMFYIDYPKDQLVIRINKRVDKMIKDGAIGEVKRLLKLKISKNNNVRKVIGFKEIFEYLEKKHSLMHTRDRICIKTRQYAKRQRTWARGQMANWQKVNPNPKNKAFGAKVVVTLNNGKKITEELDRADAHPYGARPFKRKNYINKFLTLTEGILDKKESNRFLKTVQNLRNLKT